LKKRWQEQALPSRQVIGEMIESLRSVLFPGYFGFSELKAESLCFHVGSTLDHVRRDLQEQIKRGLCFSCEEGPGCLPVCDAKARELTGEFLRNCRRCSGFWPWMFALPTRAIRQRRTRTR